MAFTLHQGSHTGTTAFHCRMGRKITAWMVASRAVFGLAFGGELCASPLVLAENNIPKATIVLPKGASPSRRATAELLQTYCRQSTGAMIPIVEASEMGPGVRVLVGAGPVVNALVPDLSDLAEDGFVLKVVDDRTLVIAGPTEEGTRFGVYEFLERCVGVRWLLPGEDGTDVPRTGTLRIPPMDVRQEPAFRSRNLSGFPNQMQQIWADRLRMRNRFTSRHNLYKLFPPSRYAKTHSEFYPTLGGRRYMPKNDRDQSWQPNFAAEGLVAEAVRNINLFLRAHPSERCVSLGINDSPRFDDGAVRGARVNFLNWPDVSDSYYRWCNEVVAGVLKQYPDMWFGCLAYKNVAEPPKDLQLHPRLVPFMTYDRMRWADPKMRAQGESLARRWAQAAETPGWYDYVYGSPYCVPRFYPHLMAEYLRFGHAAGIRAYTAEAYPNWGEGPKLYVLLKLLWDPSLNVDALLDEWYDRCVGPEAAPHLKAYFDLWERIWMQKVPRTRWFTLGREYLLFQDSGYLEAVEDADLHRARRLLEDCVRDTRTEPQRRRAELIRTAFEYYENAVIAYGAKHAGRRRDLSDEKGVLKAIDDDVMRFGAARRRDDYPRRHRNHPLLEMPIIPGRYPNLKSKTWLGGALWYALDWMDRSPRVAGRMEALSRHPLDTVATRAREVLTVASAFPSEGNRLGNGSFEGPDLAPWRVWNKEKTGVMRVAAGLGRAGSAALLVRGVPTGGPHQVVTVEPGRYLVRVYARAPRTLPKDAQFGLAVHLRSAAGGNMATIAEESTFDPGMWTPLYMQLEVPAKLGGKDVASIQFIVVLKGLEAGDEVYLDDAFLIRLPE